MKIEKLPDGSYATTPIFMGSAENAEHFSKTHKTCQHQWALNASAPAPDDESCTMHMERCAHCRGMRSRVTGPQENLDALFT